MLVHLTYRHTVVLCKPEVERKYNVCSSHTHTTYVLFYHICVY